MNDQKFFVYLLRRKDTNQVFYVGETNSPERRFQQHMEGTSFQTAPVVDWAKRAGVDIEMQIVGKFDTRQKSKGYEHELIYRARDKGYWLANHQPVPTERLRRSGKRWNETEQHQLLHMHEVEHRSPMEIADALGRGYGSVVYQLKKLGITIEW